MERRSRWRESSKGESESDGDVGLYPVVGEMDLKEGERLLLLRKDEEPEPSRYEMEALLLSVTLWEILRFITESILFVAALIKMGHMRFFGMMNSFIENLSEI